MDSTTLVTEELEAGEELARKFNESFEVAAAFWLKGADDEPWYLYLASDQVDDANQRQAYRAVMRAVSEAPSIYLDPFQVKVVPARDPIAEAAAEVNRGFPGRLVTRIGAGPFGGRYSEAVYVYPKPESVQTR